MDCTSRPKTNQQPDVANFNFLKALYGEVGEGTNTSTPQPALETSPPQSGEPTPDNEADATSTTTDANSNNDPTTEDDEGNGQERRFLLGKYSRSWQKKEKGLKDIPETVMSAYRSILQSETVPLDGGRKLRLEAGKATRDVKLIHLGYENFAVLIHQLGPLDDRDMEV